MKIGIIGHTGTVGKELVGRGYSPIDCDVRNHGSVRKALSKDYDAVVYAAGVTDVDACEEDPTQAKMVNVFGVNNVVDVFGGRLLYISTDHVFNGKKFLNSGYSEKHSPHPENMYGGTKLSGEWITGMGRSDSRIIRTSKLFDSEYVRKPLQSMMHGIPVEMTNVLRRSFLHVKHFVDGLEFVLDNWDKIPPILNISSTDIMTHYMFYCVVAIRFDLDPNLLKARNYYTKSQAPRPRRCGLNVRLARSLGVPLYSTHDGVHLL